MKMTHNIVLSKDNIALMIDKENNNYLLTIADIHKKEKQVLEFTQEDIKRLMKILTNLL